MNRNGNFENFEDETEEIIKPQLVKEDVADILRIVYDFEGGTLEQMNGYDDFNYYIKPNSNRNPHVKSISPHGYILKVINSKDSHNIPVQEAQTAFMIFLSKFIFMRQVLIIFKFSLFK